MKCFLEQISDKHFRSLNEFECREEDMENFLKNEAYKYNEDGEGNTYILINESNNIVAYYTLKANSLQIVDSESRYMKYRVFPAVEIARLAVDMNYEAQGIGSSLLAHIIKEVNEVKKIMGIKYIFLFSVPSALRFYKTKNKAKVQFKEFPKGVEFLKDSLSQDDCTPLYITI